MVTESTTARRPRLRAAALPLWSPVIGPARLSGFEGVGQGVGQDVADVIVRQPVVGDAPGLAAPDHPIDPEQSELMAERGLADPKEEGQIADAELLGKRQGVEDPRPGRIGQQAERRGDLLRVGTVDHPPEEGTDVLGMDALLLASLGGQIDR